MTCWSLSATSPSRSVALAEGKQGNALGLVRPVDSTPTSTSARPAELAGAVTLGTDLAVADAVRLQAKSVDQGHDLLLSGSGPAWPA